MAHEESLSFALDSWQAGNWSLVLLASVWQPSERTRRRSGLVVVGITLRRQMLSATTDHAQIHSCRRQSGSSCGVGMKFQDVVHTQDEKYGCLGAVTSETQMRATDAHLRQAKKSFRDGGQAANYAERGRTFGRRNFLEAQ